MLELYKKGKITKAEIYMRQFEGYLAVNISKPTLKKITDKLGYIDMDKTDLLMFLNYDSETIKEGKTYCLFGSIDMEDDSYILAYPIVETSDSFTTYYTMEEIAFQLQELLEGKYTDITELPFFKTLYIKQDKLPQDRWEVIGKEIF